MLLSFSLAFVLPGGTPVQAELQRVVANDLQHNSNFGFSIDIDEQTLVVGASGDNTASLEAGAVYVFESAGSAFVQTHKIIPSDLGNGDCFGSGVAIDGNLFVAGAPGAHLPLRYGSTYVFERTGTAWNQQAQLTATDAQLGSRFGATVDLEGDTLVVGDPSFDGQGGAFKSSGAVYVFERQGTSWLQQAKLIPLDDHDGNAFGKAVSIHGDAIAIGADGGDGPLTPGSAYVFRRNGTTWIEEDQVFSGYQAFDRFGYALDLFNDRLVVGAPSENVTASEDGAVYIFGRVGASWPVEARLLSPTSRACGLFGFAVGFMENGSLVASALDEDGQNGGWGHVFDFNGSQWQHRTRLVPSNPIPPTTFGSPAGLVGVRIKATWSRVA